MGRGGGPTPLLRRDKLKRLLDSSLDFLIRYIEKSNAPADRKAQVAMELVSQRLKRMVEPEDVAMLSAAQPRVLVVVGGGQTGKQEVGNTEAEPARISVQATALPE